ncbi:MAG: prepilin-type N-terminal cleavage/methylation domain-containing protein [Alphaproteobacteria bacterium]|nr:prepilin-type N-terminal cleavage/methylation domain-containing protein [Alphaproteobacteria bacterium]MBV8548105.1 prepilin-type N-terminal cleavage/methylation domain-containing protein [Alphaproteobacteria bacterium]
MIHFSKNRLVRSSEQAKRGFTLTEIAIVLGVIGLILGSIWVAAAAVYNNMRVSTATRGLLAITQAVRSLYATSSTVSTNADMTTIPFTTVAAGAQTTYPQSGVFDADMVIAAGGNYSVQGPWTNGSVNIVAAKSLATADSFAIEFDNVPQAACIQMLISVTGTARDPGLYAVQAGAAGALVIAAGGNATGTQTAFPLDAATARGQCANALNNVAFQFKLKG